MSYMKKEYLGYLCILVTAFIFSTMEIALKAVAGVFYPMQINMLRFLVGGVLLTPVALSALKKKNLTVSREEWLRFARLGFVCVVVSMVLYQMGVVSGRASVVAVIFSGNPIFVTFLAYLLLGEAIHRNHIAALILEVVGILCIVNPLHSTVSLSSVVLTVLSAVFFALYGVLGKKTTARFSSIVTTCFAFLFGGAEMLGILLLGRIPAVAGLLRRMGLSIFAQVPILGGISLQSLPGLLYVCAVGSALGYVGYMMAMEYTSAQKASLVFFLKPVIAPVLALLIIREEIPLNMLVGILFFLAGSLVSILPGLLRERAAAKNKPA